MKDAAAVADILDASSAHAIDYVHIKQRLWHLAHNVTQVPLCPVCNTTAVKWDKQNTRYTVTCGRKCATKLVANNPVTRAKTQHTNLEKYGAAAPAMNLDVAKKATQTKIDRYGASDGHVWKEKVQQAMLARHGVTNPSHMESVNEKKRASWKAKTPETQAAIQLARADTCNRLYGTSNPLKDLTVRAKAHSTMLERYGVMHAMQSDEIKAKSARTSMAKYGVAHASQQHLVDIVHLLEDYDWLYDQYVTQYKTSSQIAQDLGGICWYSTILDRLRQQDIAIRRTGGHSYACIQWLMQVEAQEGIEIQHALNGGEYTIPGTPYKADGFCRSTNTVYEYYGDLYHGNLAVFSPDQKCHPFNDLTAAELYTNTIERERKIAELGYNIVVMWEHDWLNVHNR